ncbi:hypothetical protein OBJ97_01095 [Empedobacter falsenii]
MHKKVLIISNNSFSKVSNNGKTYEAIFSKFDKENISQLFFSENEEPDLNYCKNYFKITDKDVLLNFITFSKKRSGKLNDLMGEKIDEKKAMFNSNSSYFFNFFQKKADLLILFRDFLWSFNSWKTPQLKKWLKETNPDVIFFVGGPMKFPYNISNWVSKFLNKPVAVYFTDDYILYPISRNILDRFVIYRAKKFYKELIELSDARFTIGELMSKEYKIFFGKDFYSIMNSVSISKNDVFIKSEKTNSKPIISYFGGLHLNRWQMISRLGSLFKNEFIINVYSIYQPNKEILESFDENGVRFCGGVISDELKRKIDESDILLHVESDDHYNRNLTKLSVSTKIPEYLISGKLVLGFGPADIASMKVLSDNEVGVVISSELNNEDIVNFKVLLKDVDVRNEIGKNGFLYAKEKFDINKNSDTFKKILESL